VDVERITTDLGIDVLYEALPTDTSAVLIRKPGGRQYIGINVYHSVTRQRFSIAHELGHARLHFDAAPTTELEAVIDRPLEVMFRDGVASQGSDALEIDANAFAAELLMPADIVRTEFHDALNEAQDRAVDRAVEVMAERFAVSTQAMRYRLINLNLVDPA
jgi:Zn-dependent peptidase ImmA (M78 family)